MTENTEKKSIIPAKYADRYKSPDWLGTFIDGQVKTTVFRDKVTKHKDEETGEEFEKTESVSTGKKALDLDKLFDLCKANAIDTADMEAQRDRKNAPGRIRMTLGNSLRAAARHRHGLFNLDGEWVEAPADFVGDSAKTHNPDGSKIKVEKAAADAETSPAEAAE